MRAVRFFSNTSYGKLNYNRWVDLRYSMNQLSMKIDMLEEKNRVHENKIQILEEKIKKLQAELKLIWNRPSHHFQ